MLSLVPGPMNIQRPIDTTTLRHYTSDENEHPEVEPSTLFLEDELTTF
jgi:hypothetical protein